MVFKNLYTFIAAHYLNIPGTDAVSEYINRTDISMWSLDVIPLCATFLLK